MFTTLTIKKKHIYFFTISLFITTCLVAFLDSSIFNKMDPLKEFCSKHNVKVNYKYINKSTKFKDSDIHNIITQILYDTLVNITNQEDNFNFDGENVYFFNKNCAEKF